MAADENQEEGQEDLFQELHKLEDTLMEKGMQEGYEAGKRLGWLEGRDLGLEKGAEIGEELGYYAGIAELVLEQNPEANPDTTFPLEISDRCHKTASRLLEIISNCDLSDPQNEDMLDKIQSARAKYKVLVKLLKGDFQELAYDPQAVKERQEMSF